MDANKPRFELTSVYNDGSAEHPEIMPLNNLPWDVKTNRRGFLGTGLIAGAALNALAKSKLYASSTVNTELNKDFEGKMLYAHCNEIYALAISPDGKLLASGSRDTTIKIWSLPDADFIKKIEGHADSVFALAFSPNGKTLASASGDKTIKLWSIPEGKLLAIFQGHSGFIQTLAISPDGKLLVSGSNDKKIKIWSLTDNNLLKTLEGHSDQVLKVCITPNGGVLASGSLDRTIKLWSLPGGELINTLKKQKNGATALAVSPDGKILASGSTATKIVFWSLEDGKKIKKIKGGLNTILSLSFSADGKMLAAGLDFFGVKLWYLPSANESIKFKGHTGEVYATAFTPDGKLLISGSKDKTIRLWNLEKKEFTGFFFEAGCNTEKGEIEVNEIDKVSGTTKTYTLACGSPLPAGAICTCNCVPVTITIPTIKPPARPSPATESRSGSYCTCNQVCTCDRVCTCVPICQAHKLLHPDKFVRTLAKEILIFMGLKELEYMEWAACNSSSRLRSAIESIINDIKSGIKPTHNNWPSIQKCAEYIYCEDEIISIMAAQMINLQSTLNHVIISQNIAQKIAPLLIRSKEIHWEKIELKNRLH